MRDALDRYYTPRHALQPLVQALNLNGPRRLRILEPCAGQLAIAAPLMEMGHGVTTADVDTGAPVTLNRDAMSWTREELGRFDAIITNPPYLACGVHCAQLVRHWLDNGAPLVACLMRLSFLEPCSSGKISDRADLLTGERSPSHVMVLPRVSYTGDGRTDNVTSCWIVWRANHTGPTQTTFHKRTTT